MIRLLIALSMFSILINANPLGGMLDYYNDQETFRYETANTQEEIDRLDERRKDKETRKVILYAIVILFGLYFAIKNLFSSIRKWFKKKSEAKNIVIQKAVMEVVQEEAIIEANAFVDKVKRNPERYEQDCNLDKSWEYAYRYYCRHNTKSQRRIKQILSNRKSIDDSRILSVKSPARYQSGKIIVETRSLDIKTDVWDYVLWEHINTFSNEKAAKAYAENITNKGTINTKYWINYNSKR